jgi:superfamily II DNA or RNA helicase
MQLREYQQKTVDLILENIKKGVKSQLINSPTGSG